MTTWMKVLKASVELNISASKISRLIKKNLIQTKKDPLDERATLVDVDEIKSLLGIDNRKDTPNQTEEAL